MSRARAGLLGLALSGCDAGLEEYRNADLQLEVLDAALGEHPDEVRVRICVEGAGNAEEALGAGRVGFPGLPAGQDLLVTVDALDDEVEELRTGRAGPVTLGASAPWVEQTWTSCEDEAACEACTATGALAAEGEPDWLLAVRFSE